VHGPMNHQGDGLLHRGGGTSFLTHLESPRQRGTVGQGVKISQKKEAIARIVRSFKSQKKES